jgi:hypothetical protein
VSTPRRTVLTAVSVLLIIASHPLDNARTSKRLAMMESFAPLILATREPETANTSTTLLLFAMIIMLAPQTPAQLPLDARTQSRLAEMVFPAQAILATLQTEIASLLQFQTAIFAKT